MRKVEIKPWFDQEEGKTVNALFVDGEVFDWGMGDDALRNARQYVNKNPLMEKAVYGDIQKHFIDSLCLFLGHSFTMKDLNEAIEKECIQ